MKLKTINKEDLETISFDDLAYIILKEKGKKMKVADLFKTVCDTLELGETAYMEQISDFFTLLSTEKRFIQLDNGYWDLRENHTAKISIKDIEEELSEDEVEEEQIEETETTEEVYDIDDTKDLDDDEGEDEFKDLVIMDPEEDEL